MPEVGELARLRRVGSRALGVEVQVAVADLLGDPLGDGLAEPLQRAGPDLLKGALSPPFERAASDGRIDHGAAPAGGAQNSP